MGNDAMDNDDKDAMAPLDEQTQAPSEADTACIQETPEEEIVRLKSALEASRREAQDNYDRFLRALADLDNYRKRCDREKSDAIVFANESLISDILPVIDNFDRALEHAQSADALVSLREGVTLTIGQALAALGKYGLVEVKAEGERFDPVFHHAISHDEGDGAGEDVVTKVFQKGYTLKGRLLRPAMVAVAKRKADLPFLKDRLPDGSR
ncbi:MAG: nucleotide exchange factor GrpE [Deltaproteobacteria bacterium]|nr:nucleotide exchange factor GrpE [Deltaproteobacteria bacterium]